MNELTWGLPVIAYLFLAGTGAGALTASAAVLLRGDTKTDYFSVARYGALIASVPVAIGSGLLIFELGSFQAGNYFRFLNLYLVFNSSPMSVGTWLLTLFLGISALYGYTFLSRDAHVDDYQRTLRRSLAWVSLPLGISVAIYTAVLIGAMPAKPFWNSPVLAMLFLVSSISTGIASIMLARAIMHRHSNDRQVAQSINESNYQLAASDILLIGAELITILLFIMFAHLSVGNAQAAITVILAGGELASLFWLGVVVVGLLVPATLEIILIAPRLLHKKAILTHRSLEMIIPIAILIGGFVLRYVIVVAGQITHPIGL